jgi:hypothetical protein
MRSREDIFALLNEPLSTLNPEELADIKAIAAADSEIALLWTQARAFGTLTETAVFGAVTGGDAEFLAALRQRIDRVAGHTARRPVFVSARSLAMVAAVCTVLLAVVMGAGYRKLTPETAASVSKAENLADALTISVSMALDSLSDQISDADSLAGFLGVSDLAEVWASDSDAVLPMTDQLLELNSKDLEEILHELEQTNFF